MHRPVFHLHLTAALMAMVLSTAALAQTPAAKSSPAKSTSDASKASVPTQAENWTREQWEAAKKGWAKETAKWADCQKQSSKQKLEGRKSWPVLYKCMTN